MSKPKGIVGFRNKLDLMFSPFILFFYKLGITANNITLSQAVPAMISFLLLVRHSYLWAAIFLAIALLLDVLDGSWARITKNITKTGHILDKTLDLFGIYTFLLAVAIAEPSLTLVVLGLGAVNGILYTANEFYKLEFYCGVRTFGLIGLIALNLNVALIASSILGITMLIIKALKFYFGKNG
jgi:phosphatidylglycerophosphate synthase